MLVLRHQHKCNEFNCLGMHKFVKCIPWKTCMSHKVVTIELNYNKGSAKQGNIFWTFGQKKRMNPSPISSLIHMDPPPCSCSTGKRERMRDWKREMQAPCLRSVGFGSLPAPFLKASPSAFWVNNPKKSTQSTASPTVNETSVYVWVKTVSHKTENSPQMGFTVGIMLEVWLTGHLCFTHLFWPISLFWFTFAMSYKSTGELSFQPLSLSLSHIKARSVCHNREPLCSVVIATDALPSLFNSFSLAFSCLSLYPSSSFINYSCSLMLTLQHLDLWCQYESFLDLLYLFCIRSVHTTNVV